MVPCSVLTNPLPRGNRGGVNFFYLEVFQAEYDSRDVEDGIDRADFMKMDIVRWDPVDTPFGIGNAFEDGQALFPDPGIEAAFVENGRMSENVR